MCDPADFLNDATFISVERNMVCVDHAGLPFHVAQIEGVAKDGRRFVCSLDEALIVMLPDKIDPRLRAALGAA